MVKITGQYIVIKRNHYNIPQKWQILGQGDEYLQYCVSTMS